MIGRNLFRAGAISLIALAIGEALHPRCGHAAEIAEIAVGNALEASEIGRYLVTFEEAGLAGYQGELPGLAATAPGPVPRASQKLDVGTPAAWLYSEWLGRKRDEHLAAIEAALGRRIPIRHYYQVTHHGVSAELSIDEANALSRLPGVRKVVPVRVHAPATFRGPAFIGADRVWDGSGIPSYAQATNGRGIRIGIIDTGVDGAHPSFADEAACGFDASHPKLVARDCTENDGIQCTGPQPKPDPGLGHGMHVASTAAGGSLDNTATPAPLLPDAWRMSGVAPCASIASYKACTGQGCFQDALVAAVQNAVADQVDVVNYSIGLTCGGGNPWTDEPEFLPAVLADVLVVASAGNTAAGCPASPVGRVTNLGPWITTVAASTHDRSIDPHLYVTGPGAPPPPLQDLTLATGSTTLPVAQTSDSPDARLSMHADNPTACNASGGLPAGLFQGSIAVIRRGECDFSEKIANAAAAGARMVVVTNNEAAPFRMDTSGAPTDVAAFSIDDLAAGDALLAFVESHPALPSAPDTLFASGFETPTDARADYRRAVAGEIQSDVLANFSLRGPVPTPMQNLAKPDVTAPGVNIYAATDPASGDYEWLSGTSMSSPHVAGAGVLLRAVQPDWSVGEVKSALMSTAEPTGFREDGAEPWRPEDTGSGRVMVDRATRAGLTLDETGPRYLAANPYGGNLGIEELNLASLRNVLCGEQCQFVRTVRNRLPGAGSWTISFEQPDGYTLQAEPAQFTLGPGEYQTLTITATVVDATRPAELTYGRLWLTEQAGSSDAQHFPVTLRGDEVSVECVDGNCDLRADHFSAGYTAIGCGESCPMLWANRFSPPPDAFPLTLRTVTFLTGSAAYVHAGDRFDVYVYQDDDRDPRNGAALAGSQRGYAVATTGARLRSINLDPPIVLDGPGDVVIAMTNPAGNGPGPAAGELSNFRGRSYVGNYTGEDPDLGSAEVNLRLNPEAIGSRANFVIRGYGTTAGGTLLRLGGETGVWSDR